MYVFFSRSSSVTTAYVIYIIEQWLKKSNCERIEKHRLKSSTHISMACVVIVTTQYIGIKIEKKKINKRNRDRDRNGSIVYYAVCQIDIHTLLYRNINGKHLASSSLMYRLKFMSSKIIVFHVSISLSLFFSLAKHGRFCSIVL